MKKTYLISLMCLCGIAAFGQTNSISTITVTDLPSSLEAVFHYLGVNINPFYVAFFIHLLAKYYRNYQIGDTHESQVGLFGKIASFLALTPLNKITSQ